MLILLQHGTGPGKTLERIITERKIGITLIATGFEQKDPVAALHKETMPAKKMEKPKEEKIVMTLGVDGEE